MISRKKKPTEAEARLDRLKKSSDAGENAIRQMESASGSALATALKAKRTKDKSPAHTVADPGRETAQTDSLSDQTPKDEEQGD